MLFRLVALFCILVWLPKVQGQQATGSIFGRVVDSTGGAVPGATVTITKQGSLTGMTVTSKEDGSYASPPLPTGLYTISVVKTSFGPVTQNDFELNDDQRAELNFTLHVGQVTEQVNVQADASTLNTFDAALGTLIDNSMAEKVPSNGSGALAMVTLDSSVVSAVGPSSDGFVDRGLNVTNIRIGGGAAGSNAILLDGANNLQNVRGEVLINSTVTGIQQNRTQYGVVSAQYGLTSGGVVTMTTRAGTSDFHGQAYENFKNGALDAANRFALPGIRPVQSYNQYGAAIGGPIKRDRAFFFANYEAYTLNQVTPQTISVPTVAQRSGDFSAVAAANQSTGYAIYDPTKVTITGGSATAPTSFTRTQFPNNMIPVSEMDPAALAFQKDFVPVPNTGNSDLPVNNYISNAPLISTQTISNARVDFQLTNRLTVAVRYAYFKNLYNNEGNYGALNTIASTRNDVQTSQDLNIAITQVLSGNLLNDIRVAVGRSYMPFNPGSAGQNWPQQLGISNLPENTLPQLSVSGYGIQVSTNQGLRTSTDPEINDTVTLLHGRHSIHVGAGFRFNESYSSSNSAPSGQIEFNYGATAATASSTTTGDAYASFLMGKPYSVSASVSAATVERSLAIFGFAQDDWRAMKRLTLNLGVRYDYESIPWEKHNGFSTLRMQPNPTNGFLGTEVYAGVNGQGSNFAAENYTNFAPRIGFAYLLSQRHHTVVRGGYALYYANTFNQVYGNATDEFGTNVTTEATTTSNWYISQFSQGLPFTPNPIRGASAGPNALLGQAATYQPPYEPTPTSQQFVLAVDHQLAQNTILHIGGFQNHGTHFPLAALNLNQLNPVYFSLGSTFLNSSSTNPYSAALTAAGVTSGLQEGVLSNADLLKPYPYFQTVYDYYPHIGRFLGRAAQVALQRPFGKNFQSNISYSYGQFLSDPLVTSLTVASISAPLQNNWEPHSEYAADPTDVRNRFTGMLVYTLPFGYNQRFGSRVSPRMNRLIGNWLVSSTFTGQSGQPLSISGGNGYAATRPNYVPGVSLKSPKKGLNEWFNTTSTQGLPAGYTLVSGSYPVGAFAAVGPCPTIENTATKVTTTIACNWGASLYSFGNVSRTETKVRGPGYLAINLNVTKSLRFGRYASDLQVQAFNALNHPNLGNPNTSFSTTSSSFGTITSASAARTLQLTARVRF